MNKTKELLEVIEGFQNLTAKIKDDNDSIKNLLKNKDLTIVACKKEYRKLYTEHEELKKKYAELESKIQQNENERIKRKRKNNSNNNKKKKKILIDYSSEENDKYDDDDDDENNEKSSEEEEEIEDKDSDFEIVKVKKNKKQKKQKKVKKVKGIIDYINSRNN